MTLFTGSPGPLSLVGRRALVAGGAGGIGRAVVGSLLAAGAEVAVLDLPGSEAVEGTLGIEGDGSDPGDVAACFRRLDEEMGGLDLCVHCVGITRDAVLWKMDTEDWERVLRVNLESAFLIVKEAVPRMRAAGGGSIVLTTSINGERGKFGQANYAASKAGLIGFGKTAARELGRFGIRVNLVAPGMVRTRMAEELPAEVLEKAESESVLGRIAEPEDVAALCLFLVSDLSKHITGQVIRVDGGQLIA